MNQRRGRKAHVSVAQRRCAKTLSALADAFIAWTDDNGEAEVMFSFIEGAAYVAPLAALPEDCIISDSARSLWRFCVERCPDATCMMFIELVERVTVAAIAQGVGLSHRAETGDA